MAICLGRSLWDLVYPIFMAWEHSWVEVPGSFRDDSWAGCWNLGLKQLPTKICLHWAKTGTLKGKNCALGPCPFLSRQNNICMVEIYRNIATWSWPDLKNRGSDTKKFVTTNHAPPSPFALKRLCWKLSVILGFLGHEPPFSFYESVINLSLFQTLMF